MSQQRELPTGTVTFLFTDIEDSTPLLQRFGPQRYNQVVDQHAEIMRKAIAANGGVDLSTAGDSFFAVFESAPSAVAAAVTAQRELGVCEFPEGEAVRVRIGIHTGEGALGGDNYVGLDVNIAARIEAAGHGGQALVSGATAALLTRALPEGVELKDLGAHRLKGIAEPEQIYQLVIEGLPESFPALKTLDARPTNLPAQLTNFIGREPEQEQIKQLLAKTRMLTLVGPGGTGKTRLSIQTGAAVLDEFDDGVFFVALASIDDPALFATEVASALSLSESGSTPIFETLKQHLADKKMLLIFDNFEQIVDAAPQVAEILSAAPGVKVLVTTREPLHISGEQEFQVPPLALPDTKNLPPLASMSQYDGVALFIQRAREVDSGFTVTDENAPAVAEIAARLDGLPLAIELAAARIKLLSPDAMLARMQDRLGLLRSGSRDVPQRQKTLRGAIDWSYDLLDEPERQLFRKLGIFVGGFLLESAEAVIGGDIDVFDGVASLLDKSLVRQDLDQKQEGRFTMLETIREYALDQLESSGEREEVGKGHAEFFARLAEEAEGQLEGDQSGKWLKRLQGDNDNLRAALSFLVESGDIDQALWMAGRLFRFWHFSGFLSEGVQALGSVLERAGAGGDPAARAKALTAQAGLHYWQADIPNAKPRYLKALEIYRSLNDMANVGWVLFSLSTSTHAEEHPGEALEYAEQAIEAYRQTDDVRGLAVAEGSLGWMYVVMGRMQEAHVVIASAVDKLRGLGDSFFLATYLTGDAQLHGIEGNHDKARESLKESLEIFEKLGDTTGVGLVLMTAAEIAIEAGDCRLALRFGGAADKVREETNAGPPPESLELRDPKIHCRDKLSPEEFAAAYDGGRGAKLEEVLEELRA